MDYISFSLKSYSGEISVRESFKRLVFSNIHPGIRQNYFRRLNERILCLRF